MYYLETFLYVGGTILIVFLTFQILFYTILSCFGIAKPKRNYPIAADEKMFLFIIPACNEEMVIGECLSELLQLNYNRNLYDVVCLVNNSTDNTFAVASQYPVAVYDVPFGADEPKGKPYVFEKYLAETEEWQNYDYIVIIDADNVVHKDFLKEINSQVLAANEEITAVQGYLGIKNILSSMISSGYSGSYFVANRTMQYAKSRLGWNATLGGTGLAISTAYIAEYGWNPKSYTEDFELQVEFAIQNRKTLWNHFAKIYDEKPNTIRASHKQRTRWSQGHWFVGISTTPRQIYSLIFKSRTIPQFFSKLEVLIYSYTMLRANVIIIFILLAFVFPQMQIFMLSFWSWVPFWLILQGINYAVIPFCCFLSEGSIVFKNVSFSKKVWRFIRLYISYFYASMVYIGAQVQGLYTAFLPQKQWQKTEHMLDKEYIIDN